MRMFTPNGDEALVMPEQVETLLEAGWSRTKPAAKKSAETPQSDESQSADQSPPNDETQTEQTAATGTGKASPFKKKV